MRKAYLIIICILLTRLASAQNKAIEPALDVDRLWQLYKDTTEVTIQVDDKEVKAHILISYNDYNKPYSIIAYGEADAISGMTKALENLKNDLGAQKLKAGYRQAPGTFTVNFHPVGNNDNVIEVSLFQKGTQSAKYGVKKVTYTDPGTNGQGTVRQVGNFFYFEVCDEGRRNAVKQEKAKDNRFVF